MGISTAQKKKRGEPEEDGFDPEFWMVTFGDLLSLLITFFVMLFAMSSLDDQILEEMFISTFSGGAGALSFGIGGEIHPPIMESVATQRQLGMQKLYDFLLNKDKQITKEIMTSLKGLTESMLAMDVVVRKRGPNFSLVFPSEKMFPPGSAQISEPVKQALKNLGDVMRFSTSVISIEGHTDSLPLRGGKFPSNWELSATRAANVMKFLVDQTPVEARRMRAIGFADTKPAVKEINEDMRARNRRIEIIVRQAPES